MLHKLTAALLSLFVSGMALLAAEPACPRQELSLDGPGWKAWLDREAAWQDDTLYAPGEFKLAELPATPPTGGWETLAAQGTPCATPACVEQLFAQGDPWWRYHGVSWFVKSIEIPAGWQGKHVRLDIARARLRVEVFVNRQLAGYDLCLESPCRFDLSPFIKAGQPNEIAIRLTNPGGSRGFNDCLQDKWGPHWLPGSRDFAGLDTASLVATDPVHVESLFVMNQLPAGGKQLQVTATIVNPTGKPLPASFTAEILPAGDGQPLHTETWQAEIPANGGNAASAVFAVPEAKLWDIGQPNLYRCRLTVQAGTSRDEITSRFGFRVFEVKADADGKSCFYLNGKRFRHRSAIDFGFYAHNGFFATPEQIQRNAAAVLAIGHNGTNLHRHIGEWRMLDAADEAGLALYEEPGGLHQWQITSGHAIKAGTLEDKLIQEKVRRMALRGRNHPSLLIHNLSNEDNYWGPEREQALRTIHALNPAIFVCNASGDTTGKYGGGRNWQPSGPDSHFRPYETAIRKDCQDDHTVGCNTPLFDENILRSHSRVPGQDLFYYGEVFCHTGPPNWWLAAEQAKEAPQGSYDLGSYDGNQAKIARAFADWNLSTAGSRLIQSPAEVSKQAARGLMYVDGRLSQRILANNAVDGYAINGWSAHSYCATGGDKWESAIVDEARNLKGPAEDYACWTRLAQVAIFRKSAKFVKPGDTASFEIRLVNEGKIPAGDYQLKLGISDGAGLPTAFAETRPVAVRGGDVYAQACGELSVPVKPEWHAGHLTLRAELVDANGKTVADGTEQVLLQNRASWGKDLKDAKLAVINWPAAATALAEAGIACPVAFANDGKPRMPGAETAEVFLAGAADADANRLLGLAKAGKTLVIKFDAAWAKLLHDQGILAAPATQWGGTQTAHWLGNGWGYLDHFVGDQAYPSKTILPTTGWEVPGNPTGFYPFESQLKKTAYGLYLARPDTPAKTQNAGIKSFPAPATALNGIADAGLFSACGYELPDFSLAVPNGDCQVTFRGAELFHDAAGKRLFDIKLQGQTVVEKLDLFAKAGGKFKPVDLTFQAKVADGRLRIGFAAGTDFSCLSGIVVSGTGADGKPWARKLCLGQKAWQDYAAPKADDIAASDPATLLVLLATLDYGQGKIVLAPSYPVDANQPFNDLLFFNLVRKAARKDW